MQATHFQCCHNHLKSLCFWKRVSTRRGTNVHYLLDNCHVTISWQFRFKRQDLAKRAIPPWSYIHKIKIKEIWHIGKWDIHLFPPSPYSDRMRKNADQNNFEYGRFPRSSCFSYNDTLKAFQSTNTLYCLKKIYVKVYYAFYEYCIIVTRSYTYKHFPVFIQQKNHYKMEWIIFKVNTKGIRTT